MSSISLAVGFLQNAWRSPVSESCDLWLVLAVKSKRITEVTGRGRADRQAVAWHWKVFLFRRPDKIALEQ